MIHKFIYSIIFILASSTILLSQNNRPQEPKAPFLYNSENVSFENKTDSISLAGTLTLPKEGTNFPAVILISGSGPQDRNSEIFGHKSFLGIADYLSSNGIAVLRVDDRGTNESTGNYNTSGLNNFKSDTEVAFDYLKSRKEINTTKIGLIGHSLGGIIAPMIASESKDINFIILLAGTGIRGDKLMLLQKEMLERKMGVNEEAIALGQKNIGDAYKIILNTTSTPDLLKAELNIYFTSIFGLLLPKSQIEMISSQLSIPWLSDFIKFDPKETLKKVNCSVLALNGANDLQVPAKVNLEAIKKTIEENGNTDVTTIELPNLNHLFQESKTGLPNEYGKIDQTFSPKALKIITNWILKRVK